MTGELIPNLSEWTGLPARDVAYIVATAPRRYKVFHIPKRQGGWRQVAQPSRELKVLQTLLVKRVLHLLPVHEAAHGYVKARGIRSNAAVHAQSNYLLKMDIENFFPSIRPIHFRRHLANHAPGVLSQGDVLSASNIAFWVPKGERSPRLCIGAPSSPFISNTLMFGIDTELQALADANDVIYSRYADDMTFSCQSKGVLEPVRLAATEIIHRFRDLDLRVNDRKTVHISKARRRMVTGVLLTPVGDLSIGRERKRLIRSMLHRHSLGQLTSEEVARLKGLLAFANDVEPAFTENISRRQSGGRPDSSSA